jgi:hypothetical protein
MAILEATKIEGYLTADPCRDLAQAKPEQLAIECVVGREYREIIVQISKVYKNGQIVIVGGDRYNCRMYESTFRRTGGGYTHSLRPFLEGETVESFLAAEQEKRQAKEAEIDAKAASKEAEHMRRLALLGGASLWEGANVASYWLPGCEAPIEIRAMAWIDAAGKLHVTHACVRGTYLDRDDRPTDHLEIWDIDRTEAGKTSIRTNNVRDAVERYITACYA